MTDNRGEVVAYMPTFVSEGHGRPELWRGMEPDPDGVWVSKSLLLAAREECEGWRQRYLAMCALAGESELGDKQMQMEIEDATERAERAEAELAECRRDAERYRWLRANHVRRWEYDVPNDSSAKSLDIDFEAEGHDLDAAIDAAIDACVGGEPSGS